MILNLQCVQESNPGAKWQGLFQKAWPSYRQWFLSEGVEKREGFSSSYSKLQEHMPELVPIYDKLTDLAGGGDLEARFLSMWCPPPYMAGCSQMVCHLDKVFLIRNYDYNPALFEGNMLFTEWLKPVIGISDCTWGLLDGMNADGLSASLAFGGSRVTGIGFGIPLLIRYILETCTTVGEAVAALQRIPVHMAYNVTLADAKGNNATVFLFPGRAAIVKKLPIATNHQEHVEWSEYAKLTETVERKKKMEAIYSNLALTEEDIIQTFLQQPLYCNNYQKNFVTLYTVNYRVTDKNVRLYWPGQRVVEQSFTAFSEEVISVELPTLKMDMPTA